MCPKPVPNGEPPEDELSYEDIDDLVPPGDGDFAPIDLDALDDEIEALHLDAPTADLLDSIAALDEEIALPDEAAATVPPAEPEQPAAQEKEQVVELEQAAQPAPEAAPADLAEPGEPPAPPPPDLIYRVLIELPPDLSGQVIELRQAGEIATMPPPGIEIAPPFRAADRTAVEAALTGWARTHLPIQIEIGGVLAEVIGTQQYVAAWAIQPEKELRAAQAALQRALEPLIAPLPDAPTAPARITIGDHVPPAPYPRLIGQMQRELEPVVWDAETVALLQTLAEALPGAWEKVGTFR